MEWLALLEGLEAEEEIPQSNSAGQCPMQHPAQTHKAAAPGQKSGCQFN
jgi:hypothetical protein